MKQRKKNISILTIENLFVKYGSQTIINGITLDIKKGEIVAIIGPNGSGKTTLFRSIIGLTKYDGEIRMYGKNVQSQLKNIGYVPQRMDFDRTFPLTVEEFLELTSGNAKEIKQKLKEVGMLDFKKQKIGELSGGQLQRVLIARALLGNPEVLLLDEPTAGVDVDGEQDFYQIIKEQNKKTGVTVLLISHEVSMVYKHATQIICLNKDLLCMGTPKEAITDEVLANLYGGNKELKPHSH